MNIVFAGTPDFSLPTLNALLQSDHHVCAIYTQPDRPAGRGRKLQSSPIKQYALSHNLQVEQPLNFNEAQIRDTLSGYQADLMIVVAYGVILPPEVLNIPRYGCINIHASLLPRWRGAAPIQRAILAGDKETGVTLMQMDKGLDTGDMLAASRYTIQADDTSATLHDQLSTLGAEALMALLPDIEQQRLKPTPQPSLGVSYAHKLNKKEAIIDWNQPALDVLKAIRSYNPWPVAHTLMGDESLRIWHAKMAEKNDHEAPGRVNVDQRRILVACQDSYLEVTELQAANKRRMKAADYLIAHSLDNLILG
ncbi:MAG: methionyl-tRNA formyltransferase [Cycloclasticus sp.]|nr:methionyl-tRNA formyltransferase [Cycloclasticus sp.]MBQ0789080.1 methionyl-tRNA formyltransferase [Cycloclasticus sp.]